MDTKVNSVLVANFIQDCQHRGLSPETLRSYREVLAKFTKAYSILPDNPDSILEFIGSFTSGDERRHGVYRVLRTFYGYLVRRYDAVSPIDRIKPPRRLPKEKMALTLEELRNLLEYPDHTTFVRTILYLLADTGIRIGELANLKRVDIGTDNTLRVSGKTGQRIVPVSLEVRYMLLQLKPASDGRLFPYKPHWWSELVSAAFQKAGVKGSAHTLRHTFCTLFRGSDISLMAITGHKSFAMVQNYSHRKLERATEEHSQAGPLARLYGTPELPQQAPSDIVEVAKQLGAAQERIKYLESLLNMSPSSLVRQN